MPSNQRAFMTDADPTTAQLPSDLESGNEANETIVFILDAAGDFKFVNSAGERLCGYSQPELRCMNIAQMMEPQFCNYLRQQLRRNMRQRFGTVYEVEIVTRQGRVILETSIQLIRNHQRAIEIHGIALRPKRRQERLTPRCLDERFAFSL